MSIQLTSLVILAAIATNIVFGAPTTSVSDSDCDLITQLIDTRYPLTDPIVLPDGSVKYRIALISDLDKNSVSPDEPFTWISYFKKGYLTYSPANKKISIEWDNSTSKGDQLKSHFSENGRGSELSELVTYDANLITLDDKTGLVYLIQNNVLIPWVTVSAGNGPTTKGMKNEWATVKDSKLYVGSHGNELVSANGQEVDRSLMWVKTIDKSGSVHHLDWTENYVKVRAAMNIHFPGYMTHEAVVWSDVHCRWLFLPRKASAEPYDQLTDGQKGTNVLLSVSPDFDDVKVICIGELMPNHGYSSFKFIPGTKNTVITAISTQEEGGVTATFIKAFTVNGEILFPETKVSDLKYEGFEFI
ncbi:soluble calcium-activated nucleotidase 1-like isoform X2 [Metopolophium dirhodum]|uniref:soluble calcium-activated nucleotidase 1-like isoform X2 n=1 Tax=Metopolophium dirhodum TaxID=44670 RepID=UPI00298FA770|nr:soluble calcium-activated nucleotidase 1-like isoform X2 [Metopolophium dirhodum]